MHNQNDGVDRCLTAEEAAFEIFMQGVSIRQWSVARGFSPSTVNRVLRGQIRGAFGVGHAVKVALGMKRLVALNREASSHEESHAQPD